MHLQQIANSYGPLMELGSTTSPSIIRSSRESRNGQRQSKHGSFNGGMSMFSQIPLQTDLTVHIPFVIQQLGSDMPPGSFSGCLFTGQSPARLYCRTHASARTGRWDLM